MPPNRVCSYSVVFSLEILVEISSVLLWVFEIQYISDPMEAILRIRRDSQLSLPGRTVSAGTLEVRGAVSAFVKIRNVRIAAEKSVVRDSAEVNSAQNTGEVKDSSGTCTKKVLGLCKRDDILLNIAEVPHKSDSSSETDVCQKRSEGALPSRGKPRGPGWARRAP